MISIPSKSQKERSIITDAIRVLAWSQYKLDNNVSGLEAYSAFEEEWKAHEIHNYDQKKLSQFVKSLGYTTEELLSERSKYYERRNQNKTEPDSQPYPPYEPEVGEDFEEPPY